nr:hypothetical protein [Mesorhizobium sp. B2-3-14]
MPNHIHVDTATLQFIQHLVEPLSPGVRTLGAADPAEIVVLLIVRPSLIPVFAAAMARGYGA